MSMLFAAFFPPYTCTSVHSDPHPVEALHHSHALCSNAYISCMPAPCVPCTAQQHCLCCWGPTDPSSCPCCHYAAIMPSHPHLCGARLLCLTVSFIHLLSSSLADLPSPTHSIPLPALCLCQGHSVFLPPLTQAQCTGMLSITPFHIHSTTHTCTVHTRIHILPPTYIHILYPSCTLHGLTYGHCESASGRVTETWSS